MLETGVNKGVSGSGGAMAGGAVNGRPLGGSSLGGSLSTARHLPTLEESRAPGRVANSPSASLPHADAWDACESWSSSETWNSSDTWERAADQPCDLVTVPARQGLEAVDILRLRDGVGPVLHDGSCDTLGFLVPPGTADGWDLPGSACTQTYGRGVPMCGAAVVGGEPVEPPVTGTGWLVPPEGAYLTATDPAVLRAALGEAARTIEAVDRCQ